MFREMGLHTVAKCENEQQELLRLAQTLFDTKMPTGQTVLQPFSDDSSIKKIAVEVSKAPLMVTK
jgi:aarF domain-containing kinase